MGSILGACIDLIHALLMAIWILGLPLLFWHRFPRATSVYAFYAIGFIVVNQVSQALLGECFLTTLARASWQRAPGFAGTARASGEWFTVRLAEAIFHLTPTRRGIKLVSEALILITAVGIAFRTIVTRRSRRKDLRQVRRVPARGSVTSSSSPSADRPSRAAAPAQKGRFLRRSSTTATSP